MAAIQGLREQIAANFRLLDICTSTEEFEIVILKEAGLYRTGISERNRLNFLLYINELYPTVIVALESLLDVTANHLSNLQHEIYCNRATPLDEVDEVDENVSYTHEQENHEHLHEPSVSAASSSSSEYSSSESPVPERAEFIKQESLDTSSFGSSSPESTYFERAEVIKREDFESSSSELSSPESTVSRCPGCIEGEGSGLTSVETHSVRSPQGLASRSRTPSAISQASNPRAQSLKRCASAMDDADADDTIRSNTLRRSTRMRRSLYQS